MYCCSILFSPFSPHQKVTILFVYLHVYKQIKSRREEWLDMEYNHSQR
nr:MAG TPA: hypothetical protein [Caudoviricetes sp.]